APEPGALVPGGGGRGAGPVERYRGPEYRRLLAAARRSLERTGGVLTGRVSVADPDDAERKAIIGITGVHQPAGTKRLTVPLGDLDAAVSQGTGRGLAELLTALGPPLRDRPAAAASLAASRAELIDLAEASPLYLACDWYRQWLGELRQDGTLTRLATQGDIGLLAQGVHALEFLEGRPADTGPAGGGPIALPALAAQITGDTKTLNYGTGLGTLVLRALALQAGVARPGSAAERRDLWDRVGVLVDDLASRVLVLNLPAEGEGLGEWLASAARYGTPFQVTLHQLAAHPIRVSCPRIFVCENPAVLRRACAELGAACPPLVCTEGRPSTAFHRLVGPAVEAGAELWYHGDFDWPGVAIAMDVITRYGGRPWRMGASDYLEAVDRKVSAIALAGEPVETPWEPGLADAMRTAGCAVYEESVADRLLVDLT
ncbi:MAG: TIGR02679 family protein, partial [Streptosporangiaceae bacterium]